MRVSRRALFAAVLAALFGVCGRLPARRKATTTRSLKVQCLARAGEVWNISGERYRLTESIWRIS